MIKLTEESVCQLAMSPFYVLYLVASEHIPPEQITDRHIVRSMENGLKWKMPLSENIFELLKSNLHEFYARFPKDYSKEGRAKWQTELMSVKKILDNLNGPPAMVADFKDALVSFAKFVAEGGAFRQKLDDSSMHRKAEWLMEVLS